MTPIRIWDLPTRIFHWALALAVIGLVITGNVGGNAMVWHFRLGYCVASLLIFRIVWGFVGGFWSRWKQFTLSPMRLKDHVFSKSSESNYLGHNPRGSLSVLVILLFLSVQVGSGLISDDEIANAGPLTHLVSEKTIQWATYWHTEIGKAIILARFIPFIRTLINPMCGVVGIPARKFFLWNVIGAIIWTDGVIALGYVLGNKLEGSVDKYLLPIIGLIVVASLAPIALEVVREMRTKRHLS